MTPIKPVLDGAWPMARLKELTPSESYRQTRAFIIFLRWPSMKTTCAPVPFKIIFVLFSSPASWVVLLPSSSLDPVLEHSPPPPNCQGILRTLLSWIFCHDGAAEFHLGSELVGHTQFICTVLSGTKGIVSVYAIISSSLPVADITDCAFSRPLFGWLRAQKTTGLNMFCSGFAYCGW
jgi:hypothetical protein